MGDPGAQTTAACEGELPAAEPAAALRIAGVDPELGFGGGETQVLGLTLALSALGHRAELVCDPTGRLWERACSAGIACHALRIRNSVDLGAGMRLRAILRRGRYDVVHFHTARAHALAPFARGFARALVVTRRMDYRPNRLFAPYLYNRAVDGVAAISRAVADALAEARVARERVTIIPSGVDTQRFRPPTAQERAAARTALGISADTVAIGTVGMLEPRKGHRVLLDALAILARERAARPNCAPLACFVAGDGHLREALERAAAESRLAGVVRWLGRIDDPRRLLWALDIFAFPSLKEGLGVAMLEAAACGLAAVASDVGGLRETVERERTALLVAPGDPAALAAALARLREDPAARAALGACARERMVKSFSMAMMAARTLEFYRACLAKKEMRG
jgi:glycosyltransferase involved in cell wall biosynthesis